MLSGDDLYLNKAYQPYAWIENFSLVFLVAVSCDFTALPFDDKPSLQCQATAAARTGCASTSTRTYCRCIPRNPHIEFTPYRYGVFTYRDGSRASTIPYQPLLISRPKFQELRIRRATYWSVDKERIATCQTNGNGQTVAPSFNEAEMSTNLPAQLSVVNPALASLMPLEEHL